MAPGPLGCLLQLAPITVPDRSPGPRRDKVPWAPVAGGGGQVGGALVGVAGARLSWSGLFSLLQQPLGAPGGAEWARVASPEEKGCLLPALAPAPAHGLSLTGFLGNLSPAVSLETKPPDTAGCRQASEGCTHLWEPGSWLLCPDPLSVLGYSVIQQTSLSTLKLSPVVVWSLPVSSLHICSKEKSSGLLKGTSGGAPPLLGP